MVTLDFLHDNFEITITSILEQGDKTIDKIQQILASAEAKLINKRATGVTGDLAMMSWGRNLSGMKRKATSEDKCYNCQKYGHFGRDCRLPDEQSSEQQSLNHRKKPRPEESTKQKPKRNRAHIAATTDNDDNSEPEPFRPGIANMVKESKMQAPRDIWYLDSCASRHLTTTRTCSLKNFDQNASISPPSEAKSYRQRALELLPYRLLIDLRLSLETLHIH